MEYGKEIYNSTYKYGYDWRCYLKLAEELIKVMQLTGAKDRKTIDVGSGFGWFADLIYFNVTKKIKCIDFSDIAINFYAKRIYPAMEHEVANAYEYDYIGYETIVMMETLEHLDRDIDLIKRFDKGSRIYFTVPFEKERDCITHVRTYNEKVIQDRYSKLIDIQACIRFGQFLIVWGFKK